MQLNFVSLDSQLIIERLFRFIPIAFPNLKQIQIKGDEQYIPLAFHTDDLMAKSIDLITNRYQHTDKLSLKLFLAESNKRIDLVNKNKHHYLSIRFEQVQLIQKYLYPYEIKFDESYYFYSGEKTVDSSCSTVHINDYLFENYLIQLDHNIELKQIEQEMFSYLFKTIINDLDVEKLLKILVYYVAKRFEPFTRLNNIRLSSHVEWDRSLLQSEKLLKFNFTNLKISGEINPIQKQIRFNN